MPRPRKSRALETRTPVPIPLMSSPVPLVPELSPYHRKVSLTPIPTLNDYVDLARQAAEQREIIRRLLVVDGPILLTVQQAGQMLQVGQRQIWRLIHSGELQAIRFSERVNRVPLRELTRFVEERSRPLGPKRVVTPESQEYRDTGV